MLNLIENTVLAMKELPWKPGTRHNLTLALAGWLRKKGYAKEETRAIIERLAHYFGDDELDDRLVAVESTFERPLNQIAGWSALTEILGEEVAKTLEFQVPRIFTYTDEAETPLFRILRWDSENGKKFHTQHFANGNWLAGLGATRQVLYRLPKVQEAIDRSEPIFIVEGEKAVHALESLGLVATTNPFGAGHWQEAFVSQLTGAAEVIIFPDNDLPGKRHGEKVLKSCEAAGIPARIVELPGLGPGEDIADLVARREISREQILRLVRQPSLPRIERIWSAADLIKAELPKPRWLIHGILPDRGLAILAGRPKIGKSWMALDIVTGIAAGGRVLGEAVENPGPTLYLALEDIPARLQQRLVIGGFSAPPEALLACEWTRMEQALPLLDEAIHQHGLKCIVIDTLARIRQPTASRSGNIYQIDYEAISALKQLADRFGVAIVLVTHLRKTPSEDPLEEVTGSMGISGAADTVLVLKRGRHQADGVLHVIGRDVPEEELAMSFDGCRWKILGKARERDLSTTQSEILDALKHLGPSTPKQVAEILGRNTSTIKSALFRMAQAGLVYNHEGRYRVMPCVELSVNGKVFEL